MSLLRATHTVLMPRNKLQEACERAKIHKSLMLIVRDEALAIPLAKKSCTCPNKPKGRRLLRPKSHKPECPVACAIRKVREIHKKTIEDLHRKLKDNQ